jgi:flagellar FliL protein
MLRVILPIVIGIVSLAGGGLAGRFYATQIPGPMSQGAGLGPDAPDVGPGAGSAAASGDEKTEFVRLSNQFIVPVLDGGRVESLVILSLSAEVPAGESEAVFAGEPKLRDGLLQALFDHANAGGFKGEFTDTMHMNALRRNLLEVAQKILGRQHVRNVLIVEILRQDA